MIIFHCFNKNSPSVVKFETLNLETSDARFMCSVGGTTTIRAVSPVSQIVNPARMDICVRTIGWMYSQCK